MDGLMDFVNDYDIEAMAILMMSCHDMTDNFSEQVNPTWFGWWTKGMITTASTDESFSTT